MNITNEQNILRSETYLDAEEEYNASKDKLTGELRYQEFVAKLINLAYETPNDQKLGERIRRKLQGFEI